MPRVTVDKNYFKFTQGKITEASPLSFPENSMKDELNIDINFDGTIQRRRGIDYEPSHVFQSIAEEILPTGGPLGQVYIWENVGDYPKPTPILVVRYGSTLQFYEAYEEPLSPSLVETITIASLGTTSTDYLSFAEAKGYLFVAGGGIEPMYISYNSDAGVFETTDITIKIRDLEGIPEENNFTRPTTLTGIHRYNLLNQGWPYQSGVWNRSFGQTQPFYANDTVLAFRNAANFSYGQAVFPSNSDIYQAFVHTGADYGLIASLIKNKARTTSESPKGKVIIDAFNENRKSLASEYSDKTTPVSPWISPSFEERSTTQRPTCVTFFQGHVLYSGVDDLEYNDKIYMSQSLTSIENAGRCYSINDPTTDIENSPLDTDGGVIRIEGVDKILALQPLGNHCLIIANNGIWSMTTQEGIFTVNSVSITKHSSIGGISNSSVVNYEGSVFFWSKAGIYMVSLDQQFATLTVNNITEQSIQRDYVSIPDKNKEYANTIVDTVNRKIYWLYNNIPDETVNCRMNRILILDTRLGAWFDYEIAVDDNYPFIVAGYSKPGFTLNTFLEEVTVGGETVTVGGEEVTISQSNVSSSSLGGVIKFLTFKDSYQVTFSEFRNRDFVDWATEIDDGVDYSSYVETGYELLEDTMRDMQATYIFCYFNRTEETFEVGEGGGLGFDFPSSCILTSKWDWTDSGSANRWSQPQQVYRFRRNFIPGAPGSQFDYDFLVIETKNKIRGKGKSVSLRFESESGKDFQLLGWSIRFTAEQTP